VFLLCQKRSPYYEEARGGHQYFSQLVDLHNE